MNKQKFNFGDYIEYLRQEDLEQTTNTSITLKVFLLFWYTTRILALYLFNKIDIYVTFIFVFVIFSMAINIYLWNKKNKSNSFFYVFSFLETFLIIYGAVFLDDFFLLLLLAGSNTITILLQNKKYTLYSATVSVFFYMFFCVYKKIDFIDFVFNTIILIGYFTINYIIARINLQNKTDVKKEILRLIFHKINKGFFFHNTFATYGNYSFESEILYSEEFGGDFISLKYLKDGEVLGIVGDTNGHGNEVFPGTVVLSIVFKAICATGSTSPKEILEIINDTLVPIHENSGGCGVFFCFHLSKDGKFTHAGGLFDGSVVLNNTSVVQLGRITIIGQDYGLVFKNITEQLKPHDKITIITDGWTYYTKTDDKTKLQIIYYPAQKNTIKTKNQ